MDLVDKVVRKQSLDEHRPRRPQRPLCPRIARPSNPQAALLRIAALGLFAVLCCPAAPAYQEAPILKVRVAAGGLPAVEQRLPKEPAVVEPVREIGRYGGDWRRLAIGPLDTTLDSRLGYEALVRWDRSGTQVVPGVARSWEVLDGGRTYVFHLREGLRWSDGQPLTSEDIQYYIEDFSLNKELWPVFPSYLALDGVPAEFRAPDAFTAEFRFQRPNALFLEALAVHSIFMWQPKHYLRQFHARYTPKEELDRRVKAAGFEHWAQLYLARMSLRENPELPTLRPFQIKTVAPAPRFVAERNPYYWKVDPAGNQLPYIDRIVFTDVQNAEILNFKAMTGEVDFQDRNIDSANYALFMENREKGGFQVRRDAGAEPMVVYVNPSSHDEAIRPILADVRFRIALSLAINREELADLIFSGLAVPARGVAGPFDPYYLPEFEQPYAEYDPERAKQLLDEVGLHADARGMRYLPNGQPFRQVLHIFPSEAGAQADQWQLVADYWWDIGLDFVTKVDQRALSVLQMQNGNTDFFAYMTAGVHWTVDPMWYVPWSRFSYFAPAYGRYVETNGKAGAKPPEEYQRLTDWYLQLSSEMDPVRKLELGRNILRQWSERTYTIGIVRADVVSLVSKRFKNVPDRIVYSYRLMTPGYIGIEQFYLGEEEPGS